MLDRGADSAHEESFYGASALDMALMNGHHETAKLLLERGVEDRETAFLFAVRSADLDLARAAVASGPFLESTLEMLHGMPMLGSQFKQMLGEIESRPDPPPPSYGIDHLARYGATVEQWRRHIGAALFYLVHHNGRLVAYDAASGDAVYKKRFSKGGVFTGSPVAANDKLYLPTEDGMMYVLAAGPEYRELAINDFGEPLMATPAVSDGVLFVRTPSRLVALASSTGASAAAR